MTRAAAERMPGSTARVPRSMAACPRRPSNPHATDSPSHCAPHLGQALAKGGGDTVQRNSEGVCQRNSCGIQGRRAMGACRETGVHDWRQCGRGETTEDAGLAVIAACAKQKPKRGL